MSSTVVGDWSSHVVERDAHVHQAIGVVAVQAKCTLPEAFDQLLAVADAKGEDLEYTALDVLDGELRFGECSPIPFASGMTSGAHADDVGERARIERAQGIVSVYDACTLLDAFATMTTCAHASDRRLSDVASRVIEGHKRALSARADYTGEPVQ